MLLVSSRLLRARAAGQEISLTHFSVLAHISRAGEASPRHLAEFEKVSPPVITRILSSLEETGYIQRRPNPEDGRRVLIRLTPEGQERVDEGRRSRRRWMTERLAGLDADERVAVATATSALVRTLLDDERP
jgi:DNA-binding MarR family transcriptional regulator